MLVAALASLCLLSTASGFEARCPRVYEPLTKAIRRVARSDRPMTWSVARDRCAKQHPGFEMLGRELLALSAGSAMALCAGHVVPVGVRKAGRARAVWDGGDDGNDLQTEPEALNSSYLALQRGGALVGNASAQLVGALDASRRTWRLVDEASATFNCALCQRAWLAWLGRLKLALPPTPVRAPPYAHAYAVVVRHDGDVDDGGNRTDAEFLDSLEEAVNSTLGQVSLEVTGFDLSQRHSHVLRILSSEPLDADNVSAALNVSHTILGWQDMDFCKASTVDGLRWDTSRVGHVHELRLPDFRLATRACLFRRLRDGDFDAAWDAVAYWLDHEQRCLAAPEKTLLVAIHALTTRPDAALDDLVALTDAVRQLQWPNGVPGMAARDAVLRDVGVVLAAKLTADDANASQPVACRVSACAFAAKGRAAESPSLFQLKRNNTPRYMDRAATDNLDPGATMAFDNLVELPTLPPNGSVAGHLFQDHEFNIFYQSRPGVWFTYWTAAILQLALADVAPAAALSVNFRIPRRAARASLDRFWAAWNLGAGRPQPCLLVRSAVQWDVYSCAGFARDAPGQGMGQQAHGSFLAYAGLETWSGLRVCAFPAVDDVAALLHRYTRLASDRSVLELVAEVAEHAAAADFTVAATGTNLTALAAMHGDLEAILRGTRVTGPCATVSRRRVKMVACSLTDATPAAGFSLSTLRGAGDVDVVAGSARNVSQTSALDVVLSVGVGARCQRFAALAVTEFDGFYAHGTLGGHARARLMVVHLVLTLRADVADDADDADDMYFDLQLNMQRGETPAPEVVGSAGGVEGDEYVDDAEEVAGESVDAVASSSSSPSASGASVARKLRVAFWNERVSDWTTKPCAKRKSTRETKLVYRCSDLRFAHGEFAGRYLIFDVYQFTDYLNEPLLYIMVAAGILSSVSVTSIAGTAVVLASWRQDLGHKILLQMTLALSGNLALGFASSLVSVDTASAACVGIGVLRHFFYLAMFAWMLVMSGLQLRRLLTVLGARATSNLLLKVSALAWGLPLVGVVVLLAASADTYRSDKADRGFCYPEGVAFVWTVQVPAAAILTLNAAIFAVILARLFSVLGWGETDDLRRHRNERTFQLLRLRAVFFIFCLFGLTWVFHLLAEQGVFREKFLYEYLFLMTASVHVFSLSCIFVFFDADTRREWAKVVARTRSATQI